MEQSKVTPIRILVVDDQALFREGLSTLIASQEDMEVVGEANDGQEAVEKALTLRPDLVLMDVQMPRMNGLDATRRICQEMPGTKVVILTVSDDDENLIEAVRAGAIGYLLKNLRASSLFERLRGAYNGEAALSPVLAARVLQEFARRPRPPQIADTNAELTDREKEILQFVINGATNRDIATRLGIAESTVKRHLHNVLKKLHLENRVQAAAYAVRKGMILPPSEWPKQ